jgi:hypothetical protein
MPNPMITKKRNALHGMYVIAFESQASFSLAELTRLMTATIIGQERWAWRVVGITLAALKQFKEQRFRYQSGSGITRAHRTSRTDMTRYVFEREAPLTVAELFNYWRETDQTVVCARGENVDPFRSEFIPINNPDGSLFTAQAISFRLGENERICLAEMSERMNL